MIKKNLPYIVAAFIVLFTGLGIAWALPSNQVLVGTVATRVDVAGFLARSGIVIQNNGPNAIFCRVGATTSLAANVGHSISAGGGVWQIPLPQQIPVYCLVAATNQVAGAATDVTEF
jgi:hypothetical protein